MNEPDIKHVIAALTGIANTLRISHKYDSSEDVNLADATKDVADAIRYGLKYLGNADAATPMGALEAHGKAIEDGANSMASATHELAEAVVVRGEEIAMAIRELADAIRERNE